MLASFISLDKNTFSFMNNFLERFQEMGRLWKCGLCKVLCEGAYYREPRFQGFRIMSLVMSYCSFICWKHSQITRTHILVNATQNLLHRGKNSNSNFIIRQDFLMLKHKKLKLMLCATLIYQVCKNANTWLTSKRIWFASLYSRIRFPHR